MPRARAASPVIRAKTSRRCIPRARCAWAARIATAAMPAPASHAGTPKDSAAYDQVKTKAHPQPRDPVFARGLANAERAYTAWLRESYDYVRFANPGDLRVAPQTCGTAGCHAVGSSQRQHQHDDARRHALGRGALQQRIVSAEECALRRKLLRRRPAADDAHRPSADARGNTDERRGAGADSAGALGDFAAGKRAARLRARRREKRRSRKSQVRRRFRPAR